MARRRGRPKKKPQVERPVAKQEQPIWQTQRKNLIIGAAVVLGLVALVIAGILVRQGKLPQPRIVPPATETPPSPTPSTSTRPEGEEKAPGAVTEGQPGRPEGTPAVKPPVKRLPQTAGESFGYTVRQNDSLYKLGMTFCNDKSAWVHLAEQNNLVYPYTLYASQVLTISCP